uniref:G_PROTEIN_RECEP_F1_2 domain-containing protein n=1 Tax=Heligmosomoides polygyrus TaxID=6339 RepID=A0A8L8JTK9_HELPZ
LRVWFKFKIICISSTKCFQIVISFMLPCVGILGIVGNGLSAFTYSRKEMVSSLNVYLCALACSDIIIILTAFFLFFMESMRKRSEDVTYYFAVLSPVMFPLGLTAQSLSVFITVASAFDCLVLVTAKPKLRNRFCSVNASLLVIKYFDRFSFQVLFIIVCVAFVYNSPHMFEIYVIDCWSMPYNTLSKDVCPTALRTNPAYLTFYYAYLYTIVMAAGPVLLLIVINSAIVVSMKRNKREDQNDSDILTLVLVVCLFISCNVLPLTVNFLELLFKIVNAYLIDLSNLMVVVNSSCNFLIYYAFGSNFRRTLRYYLTHILARKRREEFRQLSIRLLPPPTEMLI